MFFLNKSLLLLVGLKSTLTIDVKIVFIEGLITL